MVSWHADIATSSGGIWLLKQLPRNRMSLDEVFGHMYMYILFLSHSHTKLRITSRSNPGLATNSPRGVVFIVILRKLLNKPSRFRWFETYRLLPFSWTVFIWLKTPFSEMGPQYDYLSLVYTLQWMQSPGAPFTNMDLISAWTSNHMPSKVWDGITFPFLNFHGYTVEV